MHAKPVFVALALMCSIAAPAGAQPAPGFCERLAPQLGLKPVVTGGKQTWRLNQAGGLGRFLFGGPPIATAIAVSPVDSDSVSEMRRLKGTCGMTDGGRRSARSSARRP